MPIETSFRRLDRRRAKIVATLGPASSDPNVVRDLLLAGVDVFRLNLSHGDFALHEELFASVRRASDEVGRPAGILADLPGPKIRVGRFEGGEVRLDPGEEVTVTTAGVLGRRGLIPSEYEALARDLSAGDNILLDDGNMELAVLEASDSELRCRVVVGGTLRDRKGINLPGVTVSAPPLSERDKAGARFALGLGVDFLALSFVRRASDIAALRSIRDEVGFQALLVAKIEKPEALLDIEGILQEADGIMVARGDLGVELRPEQVPPAQGQLVEMARRWEKPVIVATQMLESMIRSPRPTRAEVMDVSHAVAEGADAVMLSGETAAGQYPVRAVQMMDRVIRETEGYLWRKQAPVGSMIAEEANMPPLALQDAVARATAQLSRDLEVKCIVVFTGSGWTAGKVSAGRPSAPILSATPDEGARRRTCLFWGVESVDVSTLDPGELHETTRRLAKESGLVSEGEYVLEVRGFHSDPVRNVPTIAVCRI